MVGHSDAVARPRYNKGWMARRSPFASRTPMVNTTRELIAYGLIGLIVVVAIPWAGYAVRRRRRAMLRRRGDKRFGH